MPRRIFVGEAATQYHRARYRRDVDLDKAVTRLGRWAAKTAYRRRLRRIQHRYRLR